MPDYPGFEVSDTGRMRSSTRLLPVVFRKPRVLGDSSPDQVITHPHQEPEERDSSGTVIPPSRDIGPTTVDVTDFGAVGDGVHNDTAAGNAAINSLPAAGGTVYWPNGDYLIDAEVSVRLKSKVRLLGESPAARLIAKPTSNSVYAVILGEEVSDVETDTLTIVGEREDHTGTGGEQGHGIRLLGVVRATVQNIHVSKCWGDGIKIGGARGNRVQSSDVVTSNVVSTGNRRQGMSITNANNTRHFSCQYLDTNGTAPQCGIDIEPNAETSTGGTAVDHYFEDCDFDDNASSGAHMQRRNHRITFKNCRMRNNGKKGIEAVEVETLLVEGCTITGNAGAGMTTSSESSYVTVKETTFGTNLGKAPRSTPLIDKDGVVSGTKNDVSIGASPKTLLGNNYQ